MQTLKPGQIYKDRDEYYVKVFHQVENGVFATHPAIKPQYIISISASRTYFYTNEEAKDWVPVDENGNEIKEKWQPKYGDLIWFFEANGKVFCEEFYEHVYQKLAVANGFGSPTEEKAREAFELVSKTLKEFGNQ